MKKCQFCGSSSPDVAAFCAGCGKPFTAKKSIEEKLTVEVPKISHVNPIETYINKPKKNRVILVAVAMVLVVAVIVGILLWKPDTDKAKTSNAARKVAENAVESVLNGEFYSFYQMYHDMVMTMEDWDTWSFEDDCFESGQAYIKKMERSKEEYGELLYRIQGTERIEGDALTEIQEEYEEEYGLEVAQATTFEVKIYRENSDTKNEYEEVTVVKIDGEWYLYDGMDGFIDAFM